MYYGNVRIVLPFRFSVKSSLVKLHRALKLKATNCNFKLIKQITTVNKNCYILRLQHEPALQYLVRVCLLSLDLSTYTAFSKAK